MKTLIKVLTIPACVFAAHAQSILVDPPETPAQQAARETVQAIHGARQSLIGILRDGVGRIWDSPDPAGALAALGTRAGQVVAYYEGYSSYLLTTLTEAGDTAGVAEVAAIMAKVPPLTVHEDGTVTIDDPEDPEP